MGKGVQSAALRLLVVSGAAVALIGCQSFREATGVAKLAPDEFTVLPHFRQIAVMLRQVSVHAAVRMLSAR